MDKYSVCESINSETEELFLVINNLIEESRNRVYKTINTEMVQLYWNIGRKIVAKQNGEKNAKYGDYLIKELSVLLTQKFGKGFSSTNLKNMRLFYLVFPNGQMLSDQLSWSHYIELIKIKDNAKRDFYLNECINSKWTIEELKRQKTTLMYDRVALSKNKNLKINNLCTKTIESCPQDIIKNPYVLEFLDIKENANYLENDLEKNILEHLKEFLLELGKGFAFVGNQIRITLDNDHFYPDLVFYNRIMNCFVIIDLKVGKVTHKDIGQIQMYVNYYDREIKKDTENKTIGILLSTDKNETIVRYTLPEDNQTIFSAEFRLTIPSEKDFINVIESEKRHFVKEEE